MKNWIWSSSYGFYPPKRDVFQLGVWCQNWGANVRIEVQRWNYNEIISFIYMKWSNVRIEVQMSELRWRDFTSASRGSPPYTLSQNQDNRETGYSNVLPPWSSTLGLFLEKCVCAEMSKANPLSSSSSSCWWQMPRWEQSCGSSKFLRARCISGNCDTTEAEFAIPQNLLHKSHKPPTHISP